MTTSLLERWRPVAENRQLIDLLRGMFERVGVRETDTGEAVTVAHDGDRLELIDGLVGDDRDFTVETTSDRTTRLAEQAAKPELSEVQRFRVVAAIFTAATQAILRRKRFNSGVLRRLTGAEGLIHVTLKSPGAEEDDVSHTIARAARQWLVIPGLHGKPQRCFEMTLGDTIEFQRRVMKVLRHDDIGHWIEFGKWYRAWRNDVSTVPA